MIKTTSLDPATANQYYVGQLKAVDGTPPYTWSVEPTLPAGLVLDAESGQISGKPQQQQNKQAYTFRVADNSEAWASVDIDFEVQ